MREDRQLRTLRLRFKGCYCHIAAEATYAIRQVTHDPGTNFYRYLLFQREIGGIRVIGDHILAIPHRLLFPLFFGITIRSLLATLNNTILTVSKLVGKAMYDRWSESSGLIETAHQLTQHIDS